MRKLLSIFGLFLLLSSCGDEAYYDEFVKISNDGWSADSAVVFDVIATDTNTQYVVYLQLRHNTAYPYQNLYLFRSVFMGSEVIYDDKINYRLAEPNGKWLGTGFGALKTVQAPFSKSTLKFTRKGTYRFKVNQGMRDTILQGIEEIGLRIIPLKNE